MAANGTSDPLTSILSAIESVREELVGLRADLAGPSAAVNAPVPVPVAAINMPVAAAAARENPWASLTPNQLAKKVANMSASKKQRKAAGESARPPSDWRLFADRVRSVLRNGGYSGSALGVECVQFAVSLKDENPNLSAWTDEEILARRAIWSPPGASSGVAKKERHVWSEQQKAEALAARAEKKEVKAAAGEAAATPLPAAAAQAPGGFKPILLSGERYLVNMNSGHAYHRKENGSQGNWAGLFKKEPKPYVNTSVPKPLEGGKQKSTRKHKRRHGKTRKH